MTVLVLALELNVTCASVERYLKKLDYTNIHDVFIREVYYVQQCVELKCKSWLKIGQPPLSVPKPGLYPRKVFLWSGGTAKVSCIIDFFRMRLITSKK